MIRYHYVSDAKFRSSIARTKKKIGKYKGHKGKRILNNLVDHEWITTTKEMDIIPLCFRFSIIFSFCSSLLLFKKECPTFRRRCKGMLLHVMLQDFSLSKPALIQPDNIIIMTEAVFIIL